MEANTIKKNMNHTNHIMKLKLLILFMLVASFAQARTIIVQPDANNSVYIPDATSLGYRPGDTIKADRSIVGWYMANIVGTPDSLVVITTDPGVVIGGGGSRNFELYNCRFFKMVNMYSNASNNATWTKNNKFNYKIQFSSDFIIDNIWGVNGSDGLSIKSDPSAGNPSSQYPNQIIRNVTVMNSTMDSTNNEGFYMGNTGTSPYDSSNNRPAPIYGLVMINCTARWTGWDGVQVTNAFNCYLDGIHTFKNGLLGAGGQSQGITIQARTGGAFMNMTMDSANAAALNIFACDSVYFKNITISNSSWGPRSNDIFVDNRSSQDYPFCRPRTLYMENVKVNHSYGTQKINVLNNTNNEGKGNPLPLAALPGKIYLFNYVDVDSSTNDNLNTYYGGNRPGNTPYTPDSTTEAVFVYYDDATRDVMGGKTAVSPVQIKPLAPMNLWGKAVYPGFVRLTWDTCKWNGNSPIISQKLYKKVSAGVYSLYQTLSPTTTSYNDNSVTDGTMYSWLLTSVNANGESLKLNDFSLAYTTPPQPPVPTIPGAPDSLKGTGGNGFVALTWKYPPLDGFSTITQYKIYKGTSSGSLSLLTTVGSQLTYTDNAVTNETTYWYAVSAVNAIGEGSQTAAISVKPTAFSAPDPVTSITVTPLTSPSRIVVDWLEPANTGGQPISSYEVYRGTNGVAFNKIATVAGTVFTYTDNGGVSGTKYYYYVKAINSIGGSAQGTVVNTTKP